MIDNQIIINLIKEVAALTVKVNWLVNILWMIGGVLLLDFGRRLIGKVYPGLIRKKKKAA